MLRFGLFMLLLLAIVTLSTAQVPDIPITPPVDVPVHAPVDTPVAPPIAAPVATPVGPTPVAPPMIPAPIAAPTNSTPSVSASCALPAPSANVICLYGVWVLVPPCNNPPTGFTCIDGVWVMLPSTLGSLSNARGDMSSEHVMVAIASFTVTGDHSELKMGQETSFSSANSAVLSTIAAVASFLTLIVL